MSSMEPTVNETQFLQRFNREHPSASDFTRSLEAASIVAKCPDVCLVGSKVQLDKFRPKAANQDCGPDLAG